MFVVVNKRLSLASGPDLDLHAVAGELNSYPQSLEEQCQGSRKALTSYSHSKHELTPFSLSR